MTCRECGSEVMYDYHAWRWTTNPGDVRGVMCRKFVREDTREEVTLGHVVEGELHVA